ncbi:MAG: ferredoxin reductase family protein [Acidimicrobiales bacterium]|nr:ferredoxin reductase family protein [Acidimicrobiales bacterium]
MLTQTKPTTWRDQLTKLGRAMVGSVGDWTPRLPKFTSLRPSMSWIGPLAMLASTLVGWFAFSGAQGEHGSSVAFGLFIGSVSIVLMAWSFVLAVRIRLLEPLFGGLDRMYKAHRWAGTAAVVAMFLHTQVDAEIEGGIRGASRALANSAEDLASVAQYLLYALVGISLLRVIPYRWWRQTHKLLGIPFLFASAHFFTAQKPYANSSGWGRYFAVVMIAGALAWIWRVVGRDGIARGSRYRVLSQQVSGSTTELTLAPQDRRIEFRPGQFASVKIAARTMAEPHMFSIASSPDDDQLVFHIRALGDWSDRLLHTDVVGETVWVEGPYGRFRPLPDNDSAGIVWVAGGVGITPFLSAVASLKPGDIRPLLIYCVRNPDDAVGIDQLEHAAAQGLIRLELFVSSHRGRLDSEVLAGMVGGSLEGTHVAVCGPQGLIDTVESTAHTMGAASIATEDFDIRSGVGPEVSREFAQLVDAVGSPRRPYTPGHDE